MEILIVIGILLLMILCLRLFGKGTLEKGESLREPQKHQIPFTVQLAPGHFASPIARARLPD